MGGGTKVSVRELGVHHPILEARAITSSALDVSKINLHEAYLRTERANQIISRINGLTTTSIVRRSLFEDRPLAAPTPKPADTIADFLKSHPNATEVWTLIRSRPSETIAPGRREDLKSYATTEEEAYEELMRLAGLDTEEARVIVMDRDGVDLSYEPHDIDSLTRRLSQVMGLEKDVFKWSIDEVLPLRESVMNLLRAASKPQ